MEISKYNKLCSFLFNIKGLYLFYFVSLLAITAVLVGAWFTQQFFENRLRAEKGELLTIVLEQTQKSLFEWNGERQKEVNSWATTNIIRQSANALLDLPDTKQTLQASLAQEVLREILAPMIEGRGLQGYFLISKNKVNLASSRDSNIGEVSVIAPSILDRAFAGESLVSLPQRSKVSLPNIKGTLLPGQPTMFSLAPIKAENGDVIAILAFRLNALRDFTSILHYGDIGKTGETYAFNKSGQLLSESRFLESLWSIGLLAPNMMSTFNLQLRDPGGNMMTGYRSDIPRSSQPLTLMAKKATQGEDGQNLKGYNDYRGIPVIGIWYWDEELGLGIASEIDVEEVYATLLLSRSVMIFGVFLSILIIIILNVVFTIARIRVAKSKVSLVNAQSMAHLGSWEWDIVHNQLSWSDEAYRIFKLDPAETKPSYEAFLNTVHPDDRESVVRGVEDALNNNKPYKVEHRIKCPDGSERIVFEQATLERNARGVPTYMHGSVLDITERKQAEQELTLFKTTSDMVDDCVFMFSTDSLKFFYVNRAAIKQLGYSEEELLNMTPLDIKPEFDEEAFRLLLKPLMIEGSERSVTFQTVHRSKNGNLIPVDIVLQYLAPKDESPRFVTTVRDFSERQHIEDQLKAEKEKAEQATRFKSEFLANMSHEIRTPMNGVLGMLELMRITQLDEKQTGYLHTAESSAKSLLTIINDILDFSKIEAGKMQLESTVFNLHEIVEDSVSSMSKQAETKQLDLNCYISADVPLLVTGDPVRLRQIITNLVNNAIKFTALGEVDFRLYKISENDNLLRLCFEVEDTGVGIEKEKLDGLFNAFSQADGSTTRKYGGTGLGLSICKQLVSMMHGEMKVKSELGSGSIFSFHVVFSKVEQRVERRRKNLLEDIRVLVVDHSDTNQMILGKYLLSWNVKNTRVGDSDAVLPMLRDALVNNKPYQVVLLDLLMPKIDGLKLAQMIKADRELKNIHLILLGFLAEKDDAVEDEFYIESHLTRPVRQSDLFDSLLQTIGQVEKQRRKNDVYRKANITFRGARILLVDDVPTNQVVASEMLNELGVDPVLASDGRAALREIKKSDFDLVFMDCQMPVMDGYTATEIIRAQEKAEGSRHLPIIALTAHAMKGDRETCFTAGMDDYLAKPITLDNIHRVLSQWLPDEKQHGIVKGGDETNRAEEKITDSETGVAYTADDTDGVLDRKIFEDLRRLAGERLTLLIDGFECDISKNLIALREAIKQNNAEAVVLAAHAMKGAGMSMAAIRFSDCCKTLEMQARGEDIVYAQDQVRNIEDESQRAIRKMRTLC